MGYRMEGAVIEHSSKADIISDALCLGAIQVPGHGLPIVMMADRGTTGGYTKIGTVIGPDLMKLAQAKPGDTIFFKNCSEEEARSAFLAEHNVYKNIRETLLRQREAKAIRAGRYFSVKVNNQVFRVEIEEVT